jgi:hypothetical protein
VAGAILGLTVFKNGKNGKVAYKTEVIGKGDIEALVVTSGTLNPIETVDVGRRSRARSRSSTPTSIPWSPRARSWPSSTRSPC